MPITLLIDMDAILVDILKTWIPEINNRFKENLSLEDVNNWNVGECCKAGNQVYEILHEKDFFFNLDPVPNAIETMKRLQEEGFEIFILTAPIMDSPFVFQEKIRWVQKHLPFFDINRVIFSNFKNQIKGDILFDDAPKNIDAFDRTSVIMDYPFNQGIQNKKAVRVKSWDEFYSFVHEYKEKKKIESLTMKHGLIIL